MNREELLFSLRTVLASRDAKALQAIYRHTHPADIVSVLEEDFSDHIHEFLPLFTGEQRAVIFGYLPADLQVEQLENLSRQELVSLFTRMSNDERADLYQHLSPEQVENLMPALAQAEREDIRKLAGYEEGTAGALMTSEYATVDAGLTARAAIDQLRREAPDKETIYQAFVIDAERRLVGTLSLRDLIIAPAEAKVGDLMKTSVISARVEDPAAEVAEKIGRYDLIALPILNGGDRLVGIVTYDDAMDVVEQEATEDFHKGGGSFALKGTTLRDAPVWTLFRKRVFWLIVLVFGNLFSGAGIAHFEDLIAAQIALVFFLPLLIDSGGNAGAQSSTLMVRSLATGDVHLSDWGRMLGRELGVALLLGLAMAAAVSGIGFFRGGPEIALVVSMSMVVIVTVGSLIGMSLPFVLNRFGLDPATASAPLVTSIADASGVIIYLSIAMAVLGLPGGAA